MHTTLLEAPEHHDRPDARISVDVVDSWATRHGLGRRDSSLVHAELVLTGTLEAIAEVRMSMTMNEAIRVSAPRSPEHSMDFNCSSVVHRLANQQCPWAATSLVGKPLGSMLPGGVALNSVLGAFRSVSRLGARQMARRSMMSLTEVGRAAVARAGGDVLFESVQMLIKAERQSYIVDPTAASSQQHDDAIARYGMRSRDLFCLEALTERIPRSPYAHRLHLAILSRSACDLRALVEALSHAFPHVAIGLSAEPASATTDDPASRNTRAQMAWHQGWRAGAIVLPHTSGRLPANWLQAIGASFADRLVAAGGPSSLPLCDMPSGGLSEPDIVDSLRAPSS